MKILFNKRIVLIFLIIIFTMSFIGAFVVNAEGEFVALEGDFFEQKLGGQDAVKNPSIFFNNLFQFGVYIAGFLATIMIAIGGITYMTTGAVDGKKLGKEMITSALTGLLIILFSWILLNQINPDLLNLKI